MSEKPPRSKSRRSPLEAGVALSLVFGKIACPAGGPPGAQESAAPLTVPPPTTPLSVTPAAAPLGELLDLLRRDTVLSSAPARGTLYTWTTRAQIEALARDRVLLTRTESPQHGPSFFDQVLAKHAAAGDPLSRALRAPAFARARFAWPSPWPTLLGWPDETYGDELIAVELAPEAWTAELFTSKPALSVVDRDNHPVDPAEVLRHPERIGAVYFVHDQPARGVAASSAGPAERAAYREYVLCNEAMIARWSIGGGASAGAIAESATLIERLAAALPAAPPQSMPFWAWNDRVARDIWPGPALGAALDPIYEAALALPNENYPLTRERMTALARKLRALTVQGPAITHVPHPQATPAASASAPPQARVRPRSGSY
jgi:hypothetical protein